MNKVYLAALISSTLLLAGCGNETELTGQPTVVEFEPSIQESLSKPTKVKFTLQGTEASVPIANNLLFSTTDGTLNIPTDDTSLSNPLVAVGQMDGWSTSQPISIDFGASLGSNSVSAQSGQSIAYLIQIPKPLTAMTPTDLAQVKTIPVNVIKSGARLNIVPTMPLNGGSEFLLAITNSLTDANGETVGMSESYATLKSTQRIYTEGSLASAQQLVQATEAFIAGGTGIDPSTIIYSSWFSTQSVGDTMYATKGIVAQAAGKLLTQTGGFSDFWKGAANPNNVDLTTAGTMTITSTSDFNTALNNDPNVTTFMASERAALLGKYAQFQSQFSALFPNSTISFNDTKTNVTKGTVKLPYFLETGSDWNTQPFESATPSLAIIENLLNDETEQLNTIGQLDAANVDYTKLSSAAGVAEELPDLMGLTLTKVDGSQADPQRLITRYSPVPAVKSLQDVEFLFFTPEDGDYNNLVIYQHGITSLKEDSYSFAYYLTTQDIAVLAIDAPLHGSRSLDAQRSANANVLAYMNLSYLPVARDNLRQSMMDIIHLRAALALNGEELVKNSAFTGAYKTGSLTDVSLVGHSLGGIIGTTAFVQANRSLGSPEADGLFDFKNASIMNSGGQIAYLLLGSQSFGPLIAHNVAIQSVPSYMTYVSSNCTDQSSSSWQQACMIEFVKSDANKAKVLEQTLQFAYATQTVLDGIDPINNASAELAGKIMMAQANVDATVPNNVPEGSFTTIAPFAGTEALADKIGLTAINSSSSNAAVPTPFLRYDSTALHSTFIAPMQSNLSDGNHHYNMLDAVAQFTKSDNVNPTNALALGLLE